MPGALRAPPEDLNPQDLGEKHRTAYAARRTSPAKLSFAVTDRFRLFYEALGDLGTQPGLHNTRRSQVTPSCQTASNNLAKEEPRVKVRKRLDAGLKLLFCKAFFDVPLGTARDRPVRAPLAGASRTESAFRLVNRCFLVRAATRLPQGATLQLDFAQGARSANRKAASSASAHAGSFAGLRMTGSGFGMPRSDSERQRAPAASWHVRRPTPPPPAPAPRTPGGALPPPPGG